MKIKKLLLPIMMVCAIILTACSGKDSDSKSTGNQEVEVKTVKHMKGETEIPVNPQRIVDVSGSADDLIALGIPFIASANTSMFDGVSLPEYLEEYFTENDVEVVGNYAGIMDLNLEKIAELKPDLIIMNIRHEKVYEQLAKIAPTIMIDDDMNYVNWRGRFNQIGEWFDKTSEAEKWLADYDAKAAQLAAQIYEVVGDETFAVIEANSVHFGSYYVYRTGGPGDLIFDSLQVKPSAGVPENVWGEVVDTEYFSKIDADHLFFFSDSGTLGDHGDSAAWQNMKAVKDGNVYYGANESQYNMAYTPLGKLIYMEKLANAIINHGNVE